MKEEKGTESDRSWFWSHKGERFDVFRPYHEKAHPSEWWMVIFVFHLFFKKVVSIAHLQGANQNNEQKRDDDSSASNDSFSSGGFMTELQNRGSSRSSISGGSVNSQIEVNEGDDLENRPKSKEIVDAPEDGTNLMAVLDQIPTDTLQEPPTPPAPLSSAAAASVLPRLKSFVPVGDEQTENEGKTIPVTLSEAPLPPTKCRDMASKTLDKLFRRKKANIRTEDNGIV